MTVTCSGQVVFLERHAKLRELEVHYRSEWHSEVTDLKVTFGPVPQKANQERLRRLPWKYVIK